MCHLVPGIQLQQHTNIYVQYGPPDNKYGMKKSRLVFCLRLRTLASETVLKCSKEKKNGGKKHEIVR